jgi:hypothetical protein
MFLSLHHKPIKIIVMEEHLDNSRESIKVKDMFDFLNKLMKQNKGDYDLMIDVNEYFVKLKEIQVYDKKVVVL